MRVHSYKHEIVAQSFLWDCVFFSCVLSKQLCCPMWDSTKLLVFQPSNATRHPVCVCVRFICIGSFLSKQLCCPMWALAIMSVYTHKAKLPICVNPSSCFYRDMCKIGSKLQNPKHCYWIVLDCWVDLTLHSTKEVSCFYRHTIKPPVEMSRFFHCSTTIQPNKSRINPKRETSCCVLYSISCMCEKHNTSNPMCLNPNSCILFSARIFTPSSFQCSIVQLYCSVPKEHATQLVCLRYRSEFSLKASPKHISCETSSPQGFNLSP